MAAPPPLTTTQVKPSQLANPVPGDDLAAAAEKFMATNSNPPVPAGTPAPSGGAPAQSGDISQAAQQFMAQQNPQAAGAAPERPWYDVSAQGVGQAALNAIPTLGGIAGGVAGAGLGPVGAIGGAALGGAAGYSLKTSLENALGLKALPGRGDFYKNAAVEGAEQAGGQTLGEVMPLLAKADLAVVKSVGNRIFGVPEQVTANYLAAPEVVKDLVRSSNGDVATAADTMREGFQKTINETKGKLEDPALQLMAQKTTDQSDRSIGDSVKQLITQDVKTKYAPFQEAYTNLNAISQAAPLSTPAREEFTTGLKSWAKEKLPQSSDSARMVSKYGDAFAASNNGAQFESVMGDVKDALKVAYANGESQKISLLTHVRDQADQFLQGQIDQLAQRIAGGKATPEEGQFLTQMMQARGIQEEEPLKYAQSLAKDYLADKKKVNADYGGFKNFLSNLSETTKVNKAGPMGFLKALDDVPSEKLVGKMFDEKNSAALEAMKKETPAVFDQLSRLKVKELMQDSVGKNGLDVTKFHQNVQELSPEVRNLIFTPQELATISDTVNNPKLLEMNKTLSEIDPKILQPGTNHNPLVAAGSRTAENNRALRDLGKLSLLTGENFVSKAQSLSAMESYGKTKLSKDAVLKMSVDAVRGVNAGIGALTSTPTARGMTGQGVRAGAQSLGNMLGLTRPPEEGQ